MKYKLSIKPFLITSIVLFAAFSSKAQLASQKPMPKKSDWMSKIQQNRALANKQLSGKNTATISTTSPGSSLSPQPSTIQYQQRASVNKPSQQPASGQKLLSRPTAKHR